MLIGRHSFIRQNKLSDVAGRIDYISNPKRQEHLYATYQTEGATSEFWKNLARENQLDFKASGTAGKTIEKDLVKNVEKLKELGFEITLHDKMPDVVLYREDKDWIYFVESVTSVGPMDPKRILEIEEMTKDVTAGKIFVTAFLDFKTYKKFAEELAWETEVWIAEMPEHMIHLNGDKFMGPR